MNPFFSKESLTGNGGEVGFISLTLVRIELALVLGQYHYIVTMPMDRMGDYSAIAELVIVSQT